MKLTQLVQVGFVLLSAVLVYHFVRMSSASEVQRVCAPICTMKPDYAGRDRLAPEFDLPDLQGARVRLSDYRGKVVLLNFWSETCPPCLEEMPALAEFAQKLKARGDAVLLTINVDDTAEAARAAVEKAIGGPAPFPVLLDPTSAVVAGKYGTKLYPETWVIDREGVIRARFDGVRDWSQGMALDLASTLGDARHCPIDFAGGRPVDNANLCPAFVLSRGSM